MLRMLDFKYDTSKAAAVIAFLTTLRQPTRQLTSTHV